MKWSWKIARFADIDVYVHATFFMLVAWFGYVYWQRHGSLAATLEGMLFIVLLFACVVMHEFGHALMAKRFNIKTQHITLLPIGGMASMEKMPEDPIQEIKVALAGPMVNVVIAGLLYLWIGTTNITITEEDILNNNVPFLYQLMMVNIMLVVFNLLPAYPMDGGRVLRASLALRMKHHQATAAAARIGQGFAIAFGIMGLMYSNPILILIAVFIWFGANAENQIEQTKVSLGQATAADAMLTEFHLLSPDDPLKKAVQYTLASNQKNFPVGNSSFLEGVLTQTELIRALQEFGEHAPVKRAHLKSIVSVNSHTPVQQLLAEMPASEVNMVAVSNGQNIIGIVDLENIIELVRIQDALHKRRM